MSNQPAPTAGDALHDSSRLRSLLSWRLAALLPGLAFGLSLYNYLLVRWMPATSRRALALMLLGGLVGTAAYFLLLDRWLLPVLGRMKPRMRVLTLVLGSLLGVFLMLAGTNILKAGPGNIVFLLPEQSVEISVPSSQLISDPQVVLLFFTTSAGDVPYGSIDTRGWERSGSQLVLRDFTDNHFRWTGKTGQRASLIFQRSPQGGYIHVTWDQFAETVNLKLERQDKYTYNHYYAIPFSASRGMALLLAAINFVVLSWALVLFIWTRREILAGSLAGAIQPLAQNAGQERFRAGTLGTWGLLSGIMLLAFALRAFHLDRAYLYLDELNHLVAAKDLLSGAPLVSVYQRGLYLVTLPLALSVKLFGLHLWAARLPGILLNTLAIIPLYLVLRKVNWKAALLACILYAASPWTIAVARNVREYAAYPFLFYWILYAMVIFLERFPARFVALADWKRLLDRRLIVPGLCLLLPPVYALWIDPQSTFRISLVMYLVFLAFLLAKFDLRARSNLAVLVLLVIGLAAAGSIYISSEKFLASLPGLNPYSLRYFFPAPPQQWYFDRLGMVFVIAFAAAIALGILAYRRNFIPAFLLALFAASVLGFVLFFGRFIRPRYIFNIHFWYTALIATGFTALGYAAAALWRLKRAAWGLLIAVVVLVSVNPAQTVLPALYEEPGFHPVSEEFEYNLEAVQALIDAQARPGDIIVSTIYGTYAAWRETTSLKIYPFYKIYGRSLRPKIYPLVRENPTGWIILDVRRSSKVLPLRDFRIGGKRIEYIGPVQDHDVWHWQ